MNDYIYKCSFKCSKEFKFINGIKQVIVKIYEIYEENCKICQLKWKVEEKLGLGIPNFNILNIDFLKKT